MRTATLAITLATIASPAACTEPTDDGSDDPVFADDSKADGASGARICTTQHTGLDADGDKVAFCDVPYDSAPRVTPPADRIYSGTRSSTLFAAIDIGTVTVIDRTGTRYTIVDASGNVLDRTKLPSALHMPSHRALYTIYKLIGVITAYTDPSTSQTTPAFHLTSGRPIIVIEGKAIDGAYLAPAYAFEGTVSRRTTANSFDATKQLPIRIVFQSLTAWTKMPAWESGTLKDGARYQVVGTIENWSDAVLGSDGTCMRPFTSLSRGNTWAGATDPTVRLYREPGMHFAADEVEVLDYPAGTTGLSMNGMGAMTITHPAALIQTTDLPEWTTVNILPHGTPTGHQLTLHPVTGGGGPCVQI